jgi:soluble lytic murein transglycosylase-like protein
MLDCPLRLLTLALLLAATAATAQTFRPDGSVVVPGLTLESLPRPTMPPAERGPVVPAQVERWRQEAQAYEHGDGVPRDPVRAVQLYCRASRYGDAEAQYSLAWMLTNARGIERDDAQAAHLFAAAAEQGMCRRRTMRSGWARRWVRRRPACARRTATCRTAGRSAASGRPARARARLAPLPPPPRPPPAHAPPQIVNFVKLVAPEYQLEPHVVLAVIAQESNFDPLALSPKNAQGLMQLIPDTARRFNVRNISDPAQNIRGGMAYLRWLLAYFEGDLMLALAGLQRRRARRRPLPRRAALCRDAAVRAQDHRRR